MATLEIIGSIRSTYTRVACMVCEEKGIDYVLTEKPLHAPEILAIHPFGKMPVLRHGDVELFESEAIATWLDRSFPAAGIRHESIMHANERRHRVHTTKTRS
jgi:glutathione S-transferase